MTRPRASPDAPAITTHSASTPLPNEPLLKTILAAVAAAAFLAFPLATSGQAQSRADPALRFLLMTGGAGAAAPAGPVTGPGATPGTAPGAAPFSAALEVRPGGAWVRTLVRVGRDGEDALRRHGAEIGVRVGDIVTARLPLAAVPGALREPGILRMEAAAALAPTGRLARSAHAAAPARNDSAAADAGFDDLRRRVGDRWEGLAGQGVIVGVYDSGLDLDHEDFRRADGTTRVLYAWDQTVAGAPPGVVGSHTFGDGTECGAADIDAGSCPMVDRVGHGTHVTGVAAADGSATGNGLDPYRFPGGAPAADLIVVKGGDGSFTSAGLIDGVAYIFARAAELGRPAVVNVSLSSNQGPHDGSTLLEQALDELSGPGRIVVSGSGNAGDHRNAFPLAVNGPNHASGIAGGPGHALVVPPYTPWPGTENDILAAELWYEGADSLAITIRTPAGEAVTVATGDSALVETASGTIGVLNAVGGPDPENGDHGVLIAIADYGAAPAPDTGRWAIEVTPQAVHAEGRYHLWLTIHSLAYEALPPRLEGGTSNLYLVGVPASANRVLAAGGHVTRHGWIGLGGEPQLFRVREDLGDIAYFSSPGPRRDGLQKPDITAPAKILISSLSSEAMLFAPPNDFLIEQDSVHVGLLGTSMASPQLAAAVAILLQIEPDLTPEEAREVIRLSATTDAFVPPWQPHPVWGYGKLDAGAAARRLRPDGLTGSEDVVTLSSNPVRGDALVIGHAGSPRSVAIYTIVAERVRGFGPGEVGALTTVWGLDTDEGAPVANGVYVVVVQYEDRRVLRKILVARP